MRTMNFKLKGWLLFLMSFIGGVVLSNNIKVSNISLENMNESQNQVLINFDLSWENSWRISAGPANWDAAWVFVKYKINGGEWKHATLASTGYIEPSGSTVRVSPDNVGAMIYRSEDGSGNINWEDIGLLWDYGTQVNASDIIDVQVFAMEMVYVPEGQFYLGGDHIRSFYEGGTQKEAFLITSEDGITYEDSTGNLFWKYNFLGQVEEASGAIPAHFPKGFQGFYCLKYEVTQAQWVNFFNTLTEEQKIQNDITSTDGKESDDILARNGISWIDTGDATTVFPNTPVNYVSDNRMISFLDWAGLRPMTELEFEKACRGPIFSIGNDFAWGTPNISEIDYNYSEEGNFNEKIDNLEENTGNANWGYDYSIFEGHDPLEGPRRNGVFAASSSSHTREATGATYYGIMEMSGNLGERTKRASDAATFAGSHGNGILAENGFTTIPDWKEPDGNIDFISRGGSYYTQSNPIFGGGGIGLLKVSNRSSSSSLNTQGIRGVRTAF